MPVKIIITSLQNLHIFFRSIQGLSFGALKIYKRFFINY